MHENPDETAKGSRSYRNPWIVEHRYAGHVELMDGRVLEWPPTNMVLVAEKPLVAG